MKLDVKKSLTNGEFKVAIEFKDYEVFEEGLMEDFGIPVLQIPVSTWGASAKEENGKIVITDVEKDKSSPACSIDLTKEIDIKLDDLFRAEFAVKIADIEEGTLTSAPLNTAVKMAEAKCILFIEVIKKEAKVKMDKLRAMKTDFEAVIKNPEIIKI